MRQAIKNNGAPVNVNIDCSGANAAAAEAHNAESAPTIDVRQRKYLSNVVEQDRARHSHGHRARARDS